MLPSSYAQKVRKFEALERQKSRQKLCSEQRSLSSLMRECRSVFYDIGTTENDAGATENGELNIEIYASQVEDRSEGRKESGIVGRKIHDGNEGLTRKGIAVEKNELDDAPKPLKRLENHHDFTSSSMQRRKSLQLYLNKTSDILKPTHKTLRNTRENRKCVTENRLISSQNAKHVKLNLQFPKKKSGFGC